MFLFVIIYVHVTKDTLTCMFILVILDVQFMLLARTHQELTDLTVYKTRRYLTICLHMLIDLVVLRA